MTLKVFSVFDEKGAVFSNPFYLSHNGMALRSFADLAGDKGTIVNKHPSDYKLYCLGSFDDVTGRFISLDVPEFLANASDYTEA